MPRRQVRAEPVPGYDHYKVDVAGDVWSNWSGAWKRIKPEYSRGAGRGSVTLYGPDGPQRFYVSHLVLLVFRGPCPPGLECCHENGDEGDDRLENLRWGTRLSNC